MLSHDLDHKIDFENVEMLKTEGNYRKILILEMIQINKYEKCVNKKSDTKNKVVYTASCWRKRKEENFMMDL